jgi:hypothetical protein
MWVILGALPLATESSQQPKRNSRGRQTYRRKRRMRRHSDPSSRFRLVRRLPSRGLCDIMRRCMAQRVYFQARMRAAHPVLSDQRLRQGVSYLRQGRNGHPNVARVRTTRNLRRHWQWLLLQSATCGRVDRITLVHFVLFNLARNKKGPPKQPGF